MGRHLGVSREWISKIERGHEPMSELLRIKLAGIERVHGFTSREQRFTPSDPQAPQPARDVNLKVEQIVRYVPVVSWAHAGEAVAYEQIPLHDQEQVATMSTDPRAFAINVEGESMLPDFKPGDRVIVAPSREPRNGKPCVIKLADDGVLLRLFHRLGPNAIRLSSLRPEIYPSTDLKLGEYRWCWPVEELNRKI